jgi:polyphosphate kinase 2
MNTLYDKLESLKQESKENKNIKELVKEIEKQIGILKTKEGVRELVSHKKLSKAVRYVEYDRELKKLQIELIKVQNWAYENQKRIMVLFEGRDAAGKGGAIKRFTEYLNPRKFRVVALPKPTDVEAGQFYFQRYMKELPNPGEIVFFDRSWYNRAVVEPVFDFCTKTQYEKFMMEVPEIEHALIDDGIIMIKFWFSISKETQQKRFKERMNNPLKHWKLSPVDMEAQNRWDDFTFYKEEMFSKTHTSYAPWIIVNSNDKKLARLESIRYFLSQLDYEDKSNAKVSLHPNPSIVQRYHRGSFQID